MPPVRPKKDTGRLPLTARRTSSTIWPMDISTERKAFAVSATTLVGQSLGKWRGDFAEHYSRRCRRLGLCVSLFLTFVFAVFGKYIVGLYNDNPDVLANGAKIMLVVAVLQPIQCSQFILAGALRGAGAALC